MPFHYEIGAEESMLQFIMVIRGEKVINEKLSRKVNELEHHVSDHDEILMELIKEIR